MDLIHKPDATSRNGRQNKRNISPDLSLLYGRVPPNATDLEEAVLGQLMDESEAYGRIAGKLHQDYFYHEKNRIIFSVIEKLAETGTMPDILLVVSSLKDIGKLEFVGGPYYVTKLTNVVVSSANIEKHANIIIQKYLSRELIKISGDMISMAYSEEVDIFDLMDAGSSSFEFLQDRLFHSNTKSWDHLLVELVQEMETPLPTSGLTGVPSGFRSIDRLTSGWQPTDLIILGSRPSMGKTSLGAQFTLRPAMLYKVPTGFISLEMPAKKIVQRLVAAETKIFLEKFNRRSLSDMDKRLFYQFIQRSADSNIFFNDEANHTLFTICTEIRRLVKKHQVKLVIIDYLQLITLTLEDVKKNSNRDQDLGAITKKLKNVAKELDISIIVLSQLSRAVEARSNRRPMLSDLRESGNIEQDADIVMFLYRASYYIERENPGQFMDDAIMRDAEVNFAKHRNGALGKVSLVWRQEFSGFTENDDDYIDYKPVVRKQDPYSGWSPVDENLND